jgi:putative endonuclease
MSEAVTSWFVYVLLKHNSGKGAKYTRARLPVVLIYAEEYDTKSDAMKREYVIKQMARYQKDKLCSTGLES